MSALPPHQYPAQPPAQPAQPGRGGPIVAIIGASLAALLIGGTVTGLEAAAYLRATAPTATVTQAPVISAGVGATPATSAQEVGVVTITTDLYYGEGKAAGTGMILTGDGEILTNNHVVEGSTDIQVTVESTGKTYTADVVGTDPTDDIAIIQLEDASGLTTVETADAAVALGDTVTSIGNAEGTGELVAAKGTVTATDQTITVGDDLTGKPKSLSGLIETNADVVSGDSGGPLVNAHGKVVGVVTAASSGSKDVTGYAIPIKTALAITAQITAGDESGNVTLGLPAFLGITVADKSTGAVIATVVDGQPAAIAGLVPGDSITSIDGAPVTDFASLSAIMDTRAPGDKVVVGYTDANGAASTVTVTLVGGPAK